jgi:hypothetical protein
MNDTPQADTAQSAGMPPDSPAVAALWQEFERSPDCARALEWAPSDAAGALFVAFRAGLAQGALPARLPATPSPGLLMSMALRHDHALGMPGYYDSPLFSGNVRGNVRTGRDGVSHAMRLQSTLAQMRKLYEEVSGHGFYRPELEDHYRRMAAPDMTSGDTREQAPPPVANVQATNAGTTGIPATDIQKAAALLKQQLGSTFPREELDLDAVRSLVAHAGAWLPMDSAPQDGTSVLLRIDGGEHALQDDAVSVSIGSFGVEGGPAHDPTWNFAGWCWTQDCYCRGTGTPTGWLPLPPVAGA